MKRAIDIALLLFVLLTFLAPVAVVMGVRRSMKDLTQREADYVVLKLIETLVNSDTNQTNWQIRIEPK